MNKFRVLMLCYTKLYISVHESNKCNIYQDIFNLVAQIKD